MMNALEAILRRPRVVITIMLLMLVGGISAYINLPKESQPAINVPFFLCFGDPNRSFPLGC